MAEKQCTIRKSARVSGVGLHTGEKATVTLQPAAAGSGIRFVRTDLTPPVEIPITLDNILEDKKAPRCTTIRHNGTAVHTVEHLMSALCGAGIDNVTVEIAGPELPGLDGSSIEYLKAIREAGIEEQPACREHIRLWEPICIERNGASIVIMPADELSVSYTLHYPGHKFLDSQFFSLPITGETFEKQVAPCRTFCLQEEVEQLRQAGLGKGASYENTLVVSDKGVVENTLRFENEFARHKVLDIIGDLYLLGRPVKGKIFGVKSGHALNIELLKRIYKQSQHYGQQPFVPDHTLGNAGVLNIEEIMRILPHRYPFLLVDRITDLQKGKKATGIKNVTQNEPFFKGHFPSRPIMPGVLMVEAMAQVGGVVVLTNEEHQGQVALFMAVDKVKFRKLVQPGEQLVMDVEVLRDKKRIAQLKGTARVDGTVVAEAEMMFSFLDAAFLSH